MIHGILIGALGTFLVLNHRKRGVDKCHKCRRYWQIGTQLRYIPVTFEGLGEALDTPYCKKCKPEIFP